ncbi:MAG: SLC13 family permease, partial [Succinivibrio sp.]
MSDAAITLTVLAVVAFLFVTELIPMAVTAMGAALALGLCGVLKAPEVFSGFSNSTVVLFGGMFVVGAAMLDSGLATTIGKMVVRKVGIREGPLMAALMAVTIVMSAFASNTGTVACLMPMVIGICVSAKISPAPLLMGLAVAANVGCDLTMVGTPPNMLAVAALENAGQKPFGFFEFSWIGLPICVCCTLFMIFVGRRFLPHDAKAKMLGEWSDASQQGQGSARKQVQALLILCLVVAGLIIGIPGVPPSMVAVGGALLCVLTG